jgi:hypothetical protein
MDRGVKAVSPAYLAWLKFGPVVLSSAMAGWLIEFVRMVWRRT